MTARHRAPQGTGSSLCDVTRPVPARAVAPALALALLLGAELPAGAAGAAAPARPTAAVLLDPSLPALDAAPPDRRTLVEGLAGTHAKLLGAADFARTLDSGGADLAVTVGSAFPEEAWAPFLAHLSRGGSWLHLGGVPLSFPCGLEGGKRAARPRTNALHRELGLVRAHEVDVAGLAVAATPEAPGLVPLAPRLRARRAWAFDVRFTREPEVPDESGSDGAREAVIRPLAFAVDREGTPVAAPYVAIDRLRGPMAGGRWVLAPVDAPLDAATVRALAAIAAREPVSLTVRPALAVVRPGERPQDLVTLLRPRRGEARTPLPSRAVLLDPSGREAGTAPLDLAAAGKEAKGRAAFPPLPSGAPEGLWRVRVEVSGVGTPEALAGETGFLLAREGSLVGGPAIAAGHDVLLRDSNPVPAIGMTLMAPDVHRRFLEEPEPLGWDRDLSSLGREGVNLVRTGVWTGWRRLAPGGTPSEEALRAFEAFALLSRRHGMAVVFTFFAFLPETWGGGNAYLDPRAVEAQRRFVSAFASRARGARDVVWDLVNEPSFSSPRRLWQTRPNGDASERAAFASWLGADEPAGAARVRARWRALPTTPLELPGEDDFSVRSVGAGALPFRGRDYRLFAQERFAAWVKTMTAAIREAGSEGLVTVGTDEGGTGEMPNPLLFGREVDLTGNHTWWNDGDLLWDLAVTRTPGKPALAGETGLMSAERPDGGPWNAGAGRRAILERKLVTALAAGGAGFVPWVWRTNPYMPSDNEAGIGLLRADGSAREELAAFRDVARFLCEAGTLPEGREPERAVVVLPHARLMSGREGAHEATRRAVRILAQELRTGVRAASDLALAGTLGKASLVVVPSPGLVPEAAWRALLGAAHGGATVLLTGPFDADEDAVPRGRSASLGLPVTTRPVEAEETLVVAGTRHRLRFATARLVREEKAVVAGDPVPRVRVVQLGEGRLVLSPLPVELAEESGAARALYAESLRLSGLDPDVTVVPDDPGVLVRPLASPTGLLLALVSEGGGDRRLTVTPRATGVPVEVSLPSGRSLLLALDRATGRVTATSAPPPGPAWPAPGRGGVE